MYLVCARACVCVCVGGGGGGGGCHILGYGKQNKARDDILQQIINQICVQKNIFSKSIMTYHIFETLKCFLFELTTFHVVVFTSTLLH